LDVGLVAKMAMGTLGTFSVGLGTKGDSKNNINNKELVYGFEFNFTI
jgi:hypothetical protein